MHVKSLNATSNGDVKHRRTESISSSCSSEEESRCRGPPPPPLPPFETAPPYNGASATAPPNRPKQALSAISIQDLNSVQLRRTEKMIASKTLSAPARSVSMQCLASTAEPFQAQKIDLIAELKMSKDITGIKKLKVERAKMENMVDKEVYTEFSKQFTAENFVDQIPERDASGNAIPAWKRIMLARRAAERAKRDREQSLAGEAERRRAAALPAWKRQLLQRRSDTENRIKSTIYTPKIVDEPRNGFLASDTASESGWRSSSTLGSHYGSHQRAVSIDNINLAVDYDDRRRDNGFKDIEIVDSSTTKENGVAKANGKAPAVNGKKYEEADDDARIIPWRAQLRKTNSKLNLLE